MHKIQTYEYKAQQSHFKQFKSSENDFGTYLNYDKDTMKFSRFFPTQSKKKNKQTSCVFNDQIVIYLYDFPVGPNLFRFPFRKLQSTELCHFHFYFSENK